MKRPAASIIILLVILSQSCKRSPDHLVPGDYIEWLRSEAEQFRKSKQVNDLQLTVNYLPADYLAYREFMRSDSVSYDSILKFYSCGLTFHVTLQANTEVGPYQNLLYYGVTSPEEVPDRIRFLSFKIEELFYVEHDGKIYSPVLSHYEGFDVIGNRIGFQIVFLISEYNCGETPKGLRDLVITFEDPYWDSGKNKFEFPASTFKELPTLTM